MNTTTGLIILMIFLLIMITSIIVFMVLLFKTKRVQMKFVMPDKSIQKKNLTGKITREQTFLNGIYFIDDSCMLRKFFGNEIWYYFGNPNPINFNFDKNVNNVIGTKAQDLKQFHDSDLIKKLFSTESMEKLLMILMIANIVIGVACIVVIFSTNNTPVLLSNSENNTQIIAHAVKVALNPSLA